VFQSEATQPSGSEGRYETQSGIQKQRKQVKLNTSASKRYSETEKTRHLEYQHDQVVFRNRKTSRIEYQLTQAVFKTTKNSKAEYRQYGCA